MRDWVVELLDPNDKSKVLMSKEVVAKTRFIAGSEFYKTLTGTDKPSLQVLQPYLRVKVKENKRIKTYDVAHFIKSLNEVGGN